ncbi:hypothetical protein BBP40_000464 [Aspergillus hancockii]|nr:hypothetical protein BBP40_000464 [Aspergillus hancockii]
MVYRGKPSPACEPCRARRSKMQCDQRRPSCSQCIRTKRDCSGYRDLAALSIHDQSEEVIGKARRRQHINADKLALSCGTRRSSPATAAPATLQSISFPVNDQAAGFVFSHYVRSSKYSRGHLDFLPNLLKTDTSPAIAAALTAVGLASLANIHMSRDLMIAARHEYSTALTATSAALRDEVCAQSDSTLAAVELLSMFEIVTCQGPPLIGRWLNHIEGGVRLIELRGSAQLQRPAGLELFTQLRLQVALGNLYKKEYTPSWLMELSREALTHRADSGDQVRDYFFRKLVEVGNIVAIIKEDAYDNPVAVLQRALQIDAEMVTWAMSVDPKLRYTIVKANKPDDENQTLPLIYGDHYHIYPSATSSIAWNNYRFTRIILNGTIAFLCSLVERETGQAYPHAPSEEQTTEITRQLAEDICSSVPYHLGSADSSDSAAFGIPFAGGVLRLIWPLFIATDCAGATSKMRAWIAQCLEKIGHGVGIHMAVTMAQLLRDDLYLDWQTEGEPTIAKRPRQSFVVRELV